MDYDLRIPAKMVLRKRRRPSGPAPRRNHHPLFLGGDELCGGVSRQPLGG